MEAQMVRKYGTITTGGHLTVRAWRTGDDIPQPLYTYGYRPNLAAFRGAQPMWILVGPLGAITWKTGDLGLHGRFQWSEYCTPFAGCPLHEGGQCYYDGSGGQAEDLIVVHAQAGEEAVWARMRAAYDDLVLSTLESPLEWPEGLPTAPWA